MKVPIRYKSSDRYNAGVDVVYDDESKLQYAPFVYATTASGDSGGGDEEGEDVMVVNMVSNALDATWNEIKSAVDANKLVLIKGVIDSGADVIYIGYFYVTAVSVSEGVYSVECVYSEHSGANVVASVERFTANSSDGTLTADGGNT